MVDDHIINCLTLGVCLLILAALIAIVVAARRHRRGAKRIRLDQGWEWAQPEGERAEAEGAAERESLAPNADAPSGGDLFGGNHVVISAEHYRLLAGIARAWKGMALHGPDGRQAEVVAIASHAALFSLLEEALALGAEGILEEQEGDGERGHAAWVAWLKDAADAGLDEEPDAFSQALKKVIAGALRAHAADERRAIAGIVRKLVAEDAAREGEAHVSEAAHG